jgi:1,4-alpha-glucan branching enzyme
MKNLLAILILFAPFLVVGQVVTTNPAFPAADQPVTITVDVSGTSLDHFAWDNTNNPVWIWTWIKKSGSPDLDAPTNVNPATAAQDAAKCTRISVNPDKYQITFTPTTFFGKTAAEIPQIGLKLKTRNWSDNKQTDVDKFIQFTQGFVVKFTAPTQSSFLVNTNDQIPITLNASSTATMSILVNGVVKAGPSSGTVLSYTHTVTETSGTISVTGTATSGTDTKNTTFSYVLRSPTVEASRPAGIVDGINYVIGDFTNWEVNSSYQMNKSGEHFWLEISGLTAGTEYGFQYFVDETLRMADPYSDKILDPDDQYIPASTYPSLKTFPAQAVSDKWYFNRVSVLQTNQTPYAWQTTGYQKPVQENLVIYELLIRDYFGANDRKYQSLIDTLTYLKRLGVNAIELMPITEFNGNDSWGYNPTFMFAPDKYYGTKNKLKEFIDKCHGKGIAVIMDMVMNHHDMPNPYVMMDFDFTAFKPTANNKWFNTDAKHPFNVFFDMNHESAYTKSYLDTINYYWIHEYKVDGYRYDLSKGFTQTNNPSNVGAWGAYDASRIAILKRMSDKIWSHTPDAYVILEHFADNTEEKELAEYRAGEGKGMMLWSNFNGAYNQLTMGYATSSDISGIYFANKSWTAAHAVGYMESHDEERLMYKNLEFGNAVTGYDVKSISTALDRINAANVVFYTIPGPKMLWQFGELGYDLSINTCSDFTVNSSCRISAKPAKWEYLLQSLRKNIYSKAADLIRLRNTYSVFRSGDATVTAGNGLIKQVALKNKPYNASPGDASQMNAVAVANFDMTKQPVSVNFPHQGTWYDYYDNGTAINVNALPFVVNLSQGQYKLYTDVKIDSKIVTAVEETGSMEITLFPNPVRNMLHLKSNEQVESLSLVSMQGTRQAPNRVDDSIWDISSVSPGFYLVEIRTEHAVVRKKIVKY